MGKPKTGQNTSELTKESQWWFDEVRSWLARVPFASLGAFIMCVGGIVVFSVCLYKALEFLVKQFDIGIISKIVWLIMIVHIVIATGFLLLAILSTGGTRRDVCTQCVAFNIAGRCCQCIAIATAYLFHFIWLILPTALLLPVVLLTAFAVLCHILPDCITLSDYGIPPEMVDKVNPDDIINQIRAINSSDLEKYIDQAEGMIEGALDAAEDSPILEDILSKIENNIPDEEEIERFIAMVVDNIDTEKVVGVIDKIQEGIDTGAEKIQEAIDTVADQVEKVDLGVVHEQLDNLEDNIEEYANKTDEYTDNLLEDVSNLDVGNVTNAQPVDLGTIEDAADRLANTTVDVPAPPSSRAVQKRQAGNNPALNENTRDKAEKDFEELKDAVKENIDNIREGVMNGTREASERAQQELSVLRNETEKRVADIQNMAKDLMQNVSSSLEDTKDDIVAKAEDIKENVKETADEIKQQAEKTADELREEAEKTAEDLKKQATAAADELKQKGEQMAEDIAKAVEEEKEKLRQGLEDAKDFGNQTLQELKKKTGEFVEQGKEHLADVKEQAEQFGKDIKEKGEQTVQEFVDTAKQIAEEAKMVADIAAKEAEKALKKALDAAKAVTLEVDKKAKQLAKDAESKARAAAQNAQQAATSALERAKEAIQNADDLAHAVSTGAVDLIRKAATNVRHYAKEAIRMARYATSEAIKGAREAAKMFDSVKEEVLKGYDIFMTVADQLGIERKAGSDTFCSEAKVKYCNEIIKSHICMILVFGASIILNLSMVHFLMAMAANYVHVKRELKASKMRKEAQQAAEHERDEKQPLNSMDNAYDIPLKSDGSENELDTRILSLEMSDTGSFVTRI